MKTYVQKSLALITLVSLASCGDFDSFKKHEEEPLSNVDWSHKEVNLKSIDSLIYGKSYLSVYSQVYSYTEHTSLDLTATVSIRNTNSDAKSYLIRADYYDTHGKKLHSYVDAPIAVDELETLEIVIAEFDQKGGTGANFIFEWAVEPSTSKPIFEAIMISTYGQQGLSFISHGHQIE